MSQHTLGVVGQKGGIGKSTLARLLAREYAASGWNVKIADLDPGQGTSFNWNNRRLHSMFELEVSNNLMKVHSQA